jgi:selenocysteine-specific elongation factor
VTAVIAAVAERLLVLSEVVVSRDAVAAEATRLAEVLRRYHGEHPLDPGMSLQALRAAVRAPAPPSAVVDAVLEHGVGDRQLVVQGGVAHLPGWRLALDARSSDARDKLARRLADARWQVPTVGELEREFPGSPVRALLSHLARDGTAEPLDTERYAAKGALADFRAALETALAELGSATPAELRDRFGLTRKYLIPLLEWADRRGVTRRTGDARVLARLTAGKGGS